MKPNQAFSRRQAVQGLMGASALWGLGVRAQAPYPSGPITWTVPYAPAAATDLLTRHLAEAVGAELGVSIVVDNVPGGGSTIGAARLARERADGYRLITLDVAGLAINPSLQERLSYDPLRSFTPISLTSRIPFVLVTGASNGPRSLGDFIAQAKSQPRRFTYGSAGPGSAIHMAMELLADQAGIDVLHVPYKGAAPALTDVLAGRVDVMFISLGAAMPHIRSGGLRALAASGSQRFAAAPDIKTIAEQGLPDYEASSWQGVLAPAGLAPDIRERLNSAVRKALSTDAVVAKFRELGAEPETSTGAAFERYMVSEAAKWGKLIKAKGIRAQS